jgi:hypothetical protein
MFHCFAAVTNDPLTFITFLKIKDKALYQRVADLIVFEEVAGRLYRLQKLYQKDVWDLQTEVGLDLLWKDYCDQNY